MKRRPKIESPYRGRSEAGPDRAGLRERYWERVPMANMTKREWEALCDGCGRCCLNKLEDEDSGEVAFTRVACRLLDGDTCRCANYEIRHHFVPECVVLTPQTMDDVAYFMPRTCAYRLVHEGKPLYDWHPLVSGQSESVHEAGASVRGWTVPEFEVDEEEWEEHLIEASA
ncbi:MAG: YcgN family cysteine cluster protein [Pseudomonadota bacterium]